MKKDPRLGSMPLDGYNGRIIFNDPSKDEEWQSQPEYLKKFTMAHLNCVADKMTSRIAIEMLCHVINDLTARIDALEKMNLPKE